MKKQRRTPNERTPKANVNEQEARRTLIAQLMGEGVYSPKVILAELERRKHKVGRTQLWKDMAALDAEQDRDFRDHRARFRHLVFNRYLRRDREAGNSIADIEERERTNRETMAAYRRLCEVADKLGEVRPPPPQLIEIEYSAKAQMIRASMDALEKASTMAGLATTVVGSESGDLESWAATIREGGVEAARKRYREVFPHYADADVRRAKRGDADR